MKSTKKSTKKPNPKSRTPYLRRSEAEMAKIASEIQSGLLGIRSACLKYGLCRNTLKLYLTKQAVRTLGENNSIHTSTLIMNTDPKESVLKREIQRLSKELEYAKLKILGLETMIKVADEDFKIKIRKKRGTKQSKD